MARTVTPSYFQQPLVSNDVSEGHLTRLILVLSNIFGSNCRNAFTHTSIFGVRDPIDKQGASANIDAVQYFAASTDARIINLPHRKNQQGLARQDAGRLVASGMVVCIVFAPCELTPRDMHLTDAASRVNGKRRG